MKNNQVMNINKGSFSPQKGQKELKKGTALCTDRKI